MPGNESLRTAQQRLFLSPLALARHDFGSRLLELRSWFGSDHRVRIDSGERYIFRFFRAAAQSSLGSSPIDSDFPSPIFPSRQVLQVIRKRSENLSKKVKKSCR